MVRISSQDWCARRSQHAEFLQSILEDHTSPAQVAEEEVDILAPGDAVADQQLLEDYGDTQHYSELEAVDRKAQEAPHTKKGRGDGSEDGSIG